MPDRTALLKEINEVSFAVNDVTLYLDTHPDCREALHYFNEVAPKRTALLKEFAASFGPLTIDCIGKDSTDSAGQFAWLSGPAPWEGGAL